MLVRVLVAALVALVTATSLTVLTQYNGAQMSLQESQEFQALQNDSRERDAPASGARERLFEVPDILPGNN